MRVFLDTSVLLAACGSTAGASAIVCRVAFANSWRLIVTPYVLDEFSRNLGKVPSAATAAWFGLSSKLVVMPDVLTVDRPAIFPASKDRPVLFSALAWADVLMTLDRRDFGTLIGQSFYALRVATPGAFLEQQRDATP